ncbi:MAG TPA: hypothetical protein VKR58_13280, partial [Aquella sp.]|nr:hypothetical protein [Aquella sp.]
MAINFSDFRPLDVRETSPLGGVLSDAISKRLAMAQAESAEAKAKYAPRSELANVLKTELENQWNPKIWNSEIGLREANTNKINTMTPLEAAYQNLVNKNYTPNIQSEISFRNAQAHKINTMTPLEAKHQELENTYYPQTTEAEIANKKAQSEYYKLGGGRGGVTTQTQAQLQRQISLDNPNFTPEQIFQASGAILQGQRTLPDGTPINASGLTLTTAGKVALQGTTAALATQAVRANQAEAEMPIIDKYINEGRTPYGDTIFGVSPQMQADSFDTNNIAAQTRLGKYYAADLLNFDRAALQTRIAGTESGVTIINEIMNKARQSVNSSTLLKTNKARQVALDTVSKAMNEMLAARNKVGVNLANINKGTNTKSTKDTYSK